MYRVKSGAEFINDVKSLDERLANIRLSNIEIDREIQKITYNFICDVYVPDDLREMILKEVERLTLPAFREVGVSIKKIVSNDQLINVSIYNFLKDNFSGLFDCVA